jgi:NTE family protein
MPPIAPPSAAEARTFLAGVRLFASLDAATLDQLVGHLEWWLIPGGACVFRQGDPGDALWVVLNGRLVLEREGANGTAIVTGQKGRGDTLGEMAVLTGNPRAVTVRALRDSVLARLSKERAASVLRAHPDVLLALARQLAAWLEKEPEAAPASGCVAVALTAAGPGVDLPAFARSLAASLSALGDTLHLDARAVDARLGAGAAECADGTPAHGALTRWLADEETHHHAVLYEADAGSTAWTRRCLRQADRIVVVAEGTSAPTLGPLAGELASLEADQGRQLEQLVLLHGGGEEPHDTAAWLALRPFRRHHHLRQGDERGMARLARFLSNRAIGLVLGGGGARGFAHIGVLRALDEAGIPIDRVGGTSMGAVIAAQRARGLSWQEMLDLNRRGWVKMAPQKGYTLPLISVLSSVKAEMMLAMMYGETAIEDLPTSFFCVSTNLSTTEVTVHRRGPLLGALSASMTIPGVTAPICARDGELLVDGGVLNNLPTDVMRQLGAGPIIASDVSATRDLHAHPSYVRAPSPWRLLWDSLRPGGGRRPFPTILRLVHRAALMASDVYAKSAKREVDLFLDLPMDGFDMFDMEALDRAAEHGYRFTCERLAEPGVRERLVDPSISAPGPSLPGEEREGAGIAETT